MVVVGGQELNAAGSIVTEGVPMPTTTARVGCSLECGKGINIIYALNFRGMSNILEL